MISFEFDNYTEPVAMIAKKQDDDNSSKNKIKIRLKRK